MNREEIYKRCCHLQNEIMLFELDKKSQMEVVVFNSIFSCSRCKKICMHKSKKRNSENPLQNAVRNRDKKFILWHVFARM